MIMNQFKKCKVVMLPTEKAENFPILKNVNGRGDRLYVPTKGYYYTQEYLKEKKFEAQHLYIISDNKIEDGDWVYHATSGTIFKFDLKDETITLGYEKVIATTDKSLFDEQECPVRGSGSKVRYILPEPSQSFVQKYIKAYNKGEVIKDVLIEYEVKDYTIIKTFPLNFRTNYQVRVSKDNTITIKKIKDSWTREELLEKFNYDSLRNKFHSQSELFINKKTAYLIIQWIEESLDF